MSSRDFILDNIRRHLKRAERTGPARAAVEARLRRPPRGPIPARAAALDHAGQVELFIAMAEEAAANVLRVAAPEAVPAAVAGLLQEAGLPPRLTLAAALAGLDWAGAGLETAVRRAENGDRVTVSPAFAGIAETGTLVLLSGPDSPTTLNFLPDVHVVVLAAADILATSEDAWDKLRASGRALPRTVNFITGPSRSADIEQTLQMGAHGPVTLKIVLVGA